MTHSAIVQDLQRLSAATARLYTHGTDAVCRIDTEDPCGTSVELAFHFEGRCVRGTIRSRIGGASFELTRMGGRIKFRHPGTGTRGQLSGPELEAAAARALSEGSSPVEAARVVARIARRLEHLSVLECVAAGIRETRDTVPEFKLTA